MHTPHTSCKCVPKHAMQCNAMLCYAMFGLSLTPQHTVLGSCLQFYILITTYVAGICAGWGRRWWPVHRLCCKPWRHWDPLSLPLCLLTPLLPPRPLVSSGDSSSSGSSGSSRSGREGGAADPLLPPLLLSPWDAIAALTLLGDPQEALALVSLKQWYQR